MVVFRQEEMAPRSSPTYRVTHAHAVLVFCTGGSGTIEQQGEWMLEAGDVLIRVFRRAHGLTPAAWRARHRRLPVPPP